MAKKFYFYVLIEEETTMRHIKAVMFEEKDEKTSFYFQFHPLFLLTLEKGSQTIGLTFALRVDDHTFTQYHPSKF